MQSDAIKFLDFVIFFSNPILNVQVEWNII